MLIILSEILLSGLQLKRTGIWSWYRASSNRHPPKSSKPASSRYGKANSHKLGGVRVETARSWPVTWLILRLQGLSNKMHNSRKQNNITTVPWFSLLERHSARN